MPSWCCNGWKCSQELYVYIYISLQIQASNPDALQHNGMTNSETEIENHTTLRIRLTGSNICRNYQSSGIPCRSWQELVQVIFCTPEIVYIFFILLSIISTTLLYWLYASMILSIYINFIETGSRKNTCMELCISYKTNDSPYTIETWNGITTNIIAYCWIKLKQLFPDGYKSCRSRVYQPTYFSLKFSVHSPV